MVHWGICRGQTHIVSTREQVGSWLPNNSTIVGSLVITSVTEIKLKTTTIDTILLFQLIELGLKIIVPTGVIPTSCN